MASFAFLYSNMTFLFIFILLCSLSISHSATADRNARPFKKIYAFGDSYTDTGNTKNAYGSNGANPPHGSTKFHRYSDGRLVIDFVTEELSLPSLPPYLHLKGSEGFGVNFAVAGSTAINHEFFVKNNLSLDFTPQSLQTQVSWFDKYFDSQGCKPGGGTTCKADTEDALFWFGEIGANDYAYTFGSSISGDTIRKLAIDSVTEALKALLKKGAKYLVVQGLPLTGCLPLAMYLAPKDDRDGKGCVKSVNMQSYTHNAVLQAKLQELRSQYPQAVIAYADYWNAYRTVLENANQFGFKERFKVCCGSGQPPYNLDVFAACGTAAAKVCTNPSQYINWDGVHLTEAMYKVVSNLFLHGNYSQPNFSYLLNRKQKQG